MATLSWHQKFGIYQVPEQSRIVQALQFCDSSRNIFNFCELLNSIEINYCTEVPEPSRTVQAWNQF